MVWPLTATQPSAAADVPKDIVQYLIYGHFPGIKGSVTEKGYEGWVQLQSLQWGVGLGIRYGGFGGDNDDKEEEEPNEDVYPERYSSDASVSEVTVTKLSGPDSGKFLHSIMAKKAMDITLVTATRRTAASSPSNLNPTPTLTPTSTFNLYHTLLSGLSRSTDDERTRESLSLNFGGFESITHDAEGVAVDSVQYHLATHTVTYKVWNKEKAAFDVQEVKKAEKKKKEKKEEMTAEEEVKVDGEETAVEETEGAETT